MKQQTVGTIQNNPFSPPFAHLNLRFNPFGEIDRDDRAKAAVIATQDYERWVNAFLKNPAYILQFSGECGRGKSTHLHLLKKLLQEHFPDATYTYYEEDEVVRSLPNKASLLFLDETQRIPKRLRQKLWKRQYALVIATHEDHSKEFEKHGREFEHVVLEGLSVEKLRRVLEGRLELARRTTNTAIPTAAPPQPLPYFPDETIQKLIEQFGDDIRAIEHHLYHVFQDLKELGHVNI